MMGYMQLDYLAVDRDRHGNVRYYVRLPGQAKIRLRGEPGSKEFMAAYWDALAGRTAVVRSSEKRRDSLATDSLGWLCAQYYQSPDFTSLEPSTRRVRRSILEAICREHGEKPYRLMQPRHVRMLRDERKDATEAANARLKACRRVFKFAVDYDLLDSNPAAHVPYFAHTGTGWHTWTVDEVWTYRQAHAEGSMARLAFELLLFSGTRPSDAIRLGPEHIKDRWITFIQWKNRRRKPMKVSIPLLPELERILSISPCGAKTFIVTQFGRPFTDKGFNNRMRKWCDEAGLFHCTAHGTRKAGATIAAENGATEHQLMAIFGWTTSKQATLYTRAASQKRLAGAAMHLITAGHMGNKSVPPDGDDT
jgi:integrase